MKTHPVNLAIRFFLEVYVLGVSALWAWNQFDGMTALLSAVLLPLLIAVIWAVFAVRKDPSRSGKTVVNTPGWLRFILELALFTMAFFMLRSLAYHTAASIFLAFVILHNMWWYERILWLMRN